VQVQGFWFYIISTQIENQSSKIFHPSVGNEDENGEFHDMGDAKWMIRSLLGHNDTAPGRPISRRGLA
jgi:hypothetical protein